MPVLGTYYTILYYTILYYTILYYTILYYTILYPPRGSPLTSKITKGTVLAGLGEEGLKGLVVGLVLEIRGSVLIQYVCL